MKKICFVVLTFLISSACHKKLAHFNSSSFEVFEKEPQKNTRSLEQKPDLAYIDDNIVISKQPAIAEAEDIKTVLVPVSKQKNAFIFNHKNNLKEKTRTNFKDEKTESKLKKKKRNRNPVFNDGVKIGVVFLAIAILLAILGFSSLSLLFGVVSAIFFVLGLKKYMRKKRLRNLFT